MGYADVVLSQLHPARQVHIQDCSRADVKGAVLACQEANFLHCYKDIPYISQGTSCTRSSRTQQTALLLCVTLRMTNAPGLPFEFMQFRMCQLKLDVPAYLTHLNSNSNSNLLN